MSYVLMFFGALFMPFLLVIVLYTLIFKHLMVSARFNVPWRQATWIAVVDVLEWFRLMERPAGDLLKNDLPFVRISNEKSRARAKSQPSQVAKQAATIATPKTVMVPTPVPGNRKP